MKVDILNTDLQELLNESRKKSQIEILEEDDKNEIMGIAQKRGINLVENKDLAGFKAVLTIPDLADANGQRLPKNELLKALPTIIGKPLNINHNRQYVIGNILDYRFSKTDNKAIIFGVLYKSNFSQEFDEIKKYFKEGKLGISSEIWSPKSTFKYHKDGTFSLTQMEMAGAAIVIPPETPAVSGAQVLAMAKKVTEMSDLVYATKYEENEIITAEYIRENQLKEMAKMTPEEIKEEGIPPAPAKTKCKECGEEFLTPNEVEFKCPKCAAIIDKLGNVLYPPQVMDFSIRCPHKSCGASNWLLVSRTEDNAVIKCRTCMKEYNLKFAKSEKNLAAQLMDFVYTSTEHCPQCGYGNTISGVSDIPERQIACKKCNMTFSVNILDSAKKVISSIEEIKKENKSLQGSIEMTTEPIKSDTEIMLETQAAAEVKVEEPIQATEIVAPTVETPPEPVVEAKVESPPIAEEKPATAEEVVAPPAVETVVEIPTVAEVVAAHVAEVLAEPVAEVKAEPVVEVPIVEAKKVNLNKMRVSKLIEKIRKEREDTAKIRKELEDKLELYKTNATKIVERKKELGSFSEGLTDTQILDDKDFQIAQLKKSTEEKKEEEIKAETEKINKEEVASAAVGGLTHLHDELDGYSKDITKKAFAHVNEKKEK